MTGGYVALVLFFLVGWLRPEVHKRQSGRLPFVSVVVPFRDEAGNLSACNPMERHGPYPVNRSEYIYVDDHSEDGSPEEVIALIHRYPHLPIELFSLNAQTGKKAALTTGIRKAHGEVIATLDGDTAISDRWLKTVADHFRDPGVQMLVMPVTYDDESTVFAKCTSLEFMSLVGSGIGSLKLGLPLMANGANLAFRKSAWLSVSGYLSSAHIPSGDDQFLMHDIESEFPGGVRTLHERDAIAVTESPAGPREFVQQRLRWAGKARSYRKLWPVVVSLMVLGWNGLLLFGCIAAIWTPQWWLMIGLGFGVKLMVDAVFLWFVTGFFQKRFLMPWLPLVALMYPLYIVVVGVGSLVKQPHWKGRKVHL